MARNPEEFLGQGITLPFGLDTHGDIRHEIGKDNLKSCVRLLLGTQPGELRWDPDFGVDLVPILHESQGERLEVEARRKVREGFLVEPRVEIIDVRPNFRTDSSGLPGLDLVMMYRPTGRIEPGQGVILTETVPVSLT